MSENTSLNVAFEGCGFHSLLPYLTSWLAFRWLFTPSDLLLCLIFLHFRIVMLVLVECMDGPKFELYTCYYPKWSSFLRRDWASVTTKVADKSSFKELLVFSMNAQYCSMTHPFTWFQTILSRIFERMLKFVSCKQGNWSLETISKWPKWMAALKCACSDMLGIGTHISSPLHGLLLVSLMHHDPSSRKKSIPRHPGFATEPLAVQNRRRIVESCAYFWGGAQD